MSPSTSLPLSLMMSASWSPSLSHIYTHTSHACMCLCCCVWLVSGKKEWRVRAPRTPTGQPEAPCPSKAALRGPHGLLFAASAPLIANSFFSFPFEICAVTCFMCSYTQTNIKSRKYVLCCIALHCVVCHCLCFKPVVVVMLLLCLLVCLLLHISGKRLQAHMRVHTHTRTHTHKEPGACWTTLSMCLCALVESQSVISF